MNKTNINDLTREQRRAYMRAEYQKQSRFQRMFGADEVEVDCAAHYERLRGEITRLLVEKKIIPYAVPLENLHEFLDDEMRAYGFDDGVNKVTTFFYDTDRAFQAAYRSFVKEVFHDRTFQMPMWYQATPTIRIHCPNGLNSDHYPRYHTDVGYGHPPEEINVWVPLTEKREGHSFRNTSVPISREIFEPFDYDVHNFIEKAVTDKAFNAKCGQLSHAVETERGRAYLFDSRCIHTGEPLKAHTRVSLDLRVVPLVDFDRAPYIFQGTGRRRILFAPGHCYSNESTDLMNP